MQNITEIKGLIAADKIAEASDKLDRLLIEQPDDSEAWYLRGRLYWRSGERTQAMSCYAHSASIDPDGPASFALQQAREIADFFNPDLLNP